MNEQGLRPGILRVTDVSMHHPEPKPKKEAGPVKTYKLTPEELEKYRGLKVPPKKQDYSTTAPQSSRRSGKYQRTGGEWG